MTFRRDFFWNFQECHLYSISLADHTKHTPYGKGIVKVYFPDIGERMISNVWYVPTFKQNLLSLVTIRQEGHQVIMEDGLVKINLVKKYMKTVMIGYEDEKLLRMKGTVIPRHLDFAGIVSTCISPIRLWHVRYGHLNFDSLSQLQKQGMVKRLPTFKKDTSKCEACIYGKHSRESFSKGSWHANRRLQLVHSDVCGLLEISFGGCKYFLLFVDDFSRITWVYFLKQKFEVFENFKIFRKLVENEVKEKIGTLRIDNGGEFTCNEFNTYCTDNGIRRHLTNLYTPQPNGVAERMNHTLLGMARSMLSFKRLSSTYWAEAIHTAIYLRNRSPTASLDGITPYEAWFGFKPRVKHLRVFGSICYALVPKEK
jgi:transposase InsO family protein